MEEAKPKDAGEPLGVMSDGSIAAPNPSDSTGNVSAERVMRLNKAADEAEDFLLPYDKATPEQIAAGDELKAEAERTTALFKAQEFAEAIANHPENPSAASAAVQQTFPSREAESVYSPSSESKINKQNQKRLQQQAQDQQTKLLTKSKRTQDLMFEGGAVPLPTSSSSLPLSSSSSSSVPPPAAVPNQLPSSLSNPSISSDCGQLTDGAPCGTGVCQKGYCVERQCFGECCDQKTMFFVADGTRCAHKGRCKGGVCFVKEADTMEYVEKIAVNEKAYRKELNHIFDLNEKYAKKKAIRWFNTAQ
jgi:hypothetical protein